MYPSEEETSGDYTLSDALEEIFPGYASNWKTIGDLAALALRVRATPQQVLAFPGWLSERHPKKALGPYAFKDLFCESIKPSTIGHKVRGNGQAARHCGNCNQGWLPPGPGETYAKHCPCVNGAHAK